MGGPSLATHPRRPYGVARSLVLGVLVAALVACSREVPPLPGDDLPAVSVAPRPEPALPLPPAELSEPLEAASGPLDGLPEPTILPAHMAEPFTGDLSEIRSRGVVRALVSLSRTDFFLETGRPLGLQAEALERFERFLNRGAARGARRLRVAYVPVPFDELLSALRRGRGDVAVGFLTMTPEREQLVDFASGRSRTVNEIVVAGPKVAGLVALEDLAGRSVHVMRGSSYAGHLRELSRRLVAAGARPLDVVEMDPHLVTEDILELVNAGVVDLTVADDFRARAWARVLPGIVLREDLVVHGGGNVGWAVRKGSPELLAAVSRFLREVKKGTLVGNVLFQRYYVDTRWIENPISREERAKLDAYSALFRKYADRYGFDWLAIAAQAYQESGLQHGRRSPAGAVGLMQVMPRTAADPRIGIADVADLESNVHAGVKYMALLRDTYFDEPDLREDERLAFVWAAYNAGPSKVRRMRSRARAMGLDSDRWFRNVEHAALDLVGREPVRYVSNVYKYYVAYKLAADLRSGTTRAPPTKTRPGSV